MIYKKPISAQGELSGNLVHNFVLRFSSKHTSIDAMKGLLFFFATTLSPILVQLANVRSPQNLVFITSNVFYERIL